MTTFVNNDVASGNVIQASDHNTQGALIAAVVNGNIDSGNLASNSVTTAKIADSNVTTAKIADGAVTPVKSTNPYKFSVHLASNQSGIVDSTYTKVLFDTEKFDTNNNFASNKYTAPVAGYYQINAYVKMLSPSNNAFTGSLFLYKNGVSVQEGGSMYPSGTGATIYSTGNISHLVQLAANDTLEIYVWMDVNTSTVTVLGGSTVSTFSGYLVSVT